MTSNLLGRALGTTSAQDVATIETSRLLRCLQAAPGITFNGSERRPNGNDQKQLYGGHGAEGVGEEHGVWAHKAGVNCLTIDRFEGR